MVETHMLQICPAPPLPELPKLHTTAEEPEVLLHTMAEEPEVLLILTLLLELDTLPTILTSELLTRLAKPFATIFPGTDSASSVFSGITSLALKLMDSFPILTSIDSLESASRHQLASKSLSTLIT